MIVTSLESHLSYWSGNHGELQLGGKLSPYHSFNYIYSNEKKKMHID